MVVWKAAMIHTDHQYWRISMSYPDAADEDVRRYERFFRKLPPAHKALLSHYPLKFQRLRQCISLNSHFIFNMLQDIDLEEDQHLEYGQKDHIVREGINSCSCESAPLRITCSVSNRHGCVEGNNDSYQSSVPAHPNKTTVTSSQQQWLDPSFQLNVLLVDVDKECVEGNEFSYYMMICSSFILNHCQTAGEWTIYPWIHSNCNSLSDQFMDIGSFLSFYKIKLIRRK
ncbi:S-adenosyl-L-methionine-dependent methyltransferase superfamily protein [Trifolium repens]|nr:S-adenosyl-L-methionine-dependent methyltransferase superfamily protein [Trifolium repens]